jgi:hypothetical protein
MEAPRLASCLSLLPYSFSFLKQHCKNATGVIAHIVHHNIPSQKKTNLSFSKGIRGVQAA